jgi:hypothetical protein
VRTDIDNSKKRHIEKSGIGIKIIGSGRFSSTVGKKALNCQLLKIALSAMVTIRPVGQKGDFSLVIGACLLMSQSEAEHQYMTDWWADSVYMKGLVSALAILQGIKKSLKR